MSYSSTNEIWNNLGKDAFTKIRSEVVGTGSGVISSWELDHDNLIADSLTLYTDSTAVPTGSYSLTLDDGSIAGLTASSGSVLTADYNYADLPDSTITEMISSSDQTINDDLRNFENNTGTTEYLNVDYGQKVFFLKNYPILTLTSIERNITSPTSAPDWETLTSGLGNDYIANEEDLSIGRIRFIDNFPYEGDDTLRANYDWGYTSTPSRVKELSILLTIRQMAQSSVYKSVFKGNDNFTPVRTIEIENRIEYLMKKLKKQGVTKI